jgi:uncharacterized membrane protein YcjF (UPF0283 family)
MGGATVIILVQSVIILLLLGVSIYGAFELMRSRKRASEKAALADYWHAEAASAGSRLRETEAANERLRVQLQQIPLAPRKEKVEDSVIRAKSPAQVRQLTEQAWGPKPGDKDESVN